MTFATVRTTRTRRPVGAVVLGGAALALFVGAGFAMGQAESLDTDGDGMISYAEILVAMPDMTEAEFQALDANADGMLDAEEVAAAEQAGLITAG